MSYETSPPARAQITAIYNYRDEAGNLLFQVARTDPKGFFQRRPDGRGGWTYSLDGVRRVPYRLPDLIVALKNLPPEARIVYVTEGEKDADRLWDMGFPATTNPGGAGKWSDEYTERLKAAGATQVVSSPDNDPPGEAHVLAVARSCFRAGLAVKIVHLPGLPPKGDVSAWLDAGHTKEELLALVESAPALAAEDLDQEQHSVHSSEPVLVCLADVQPEKVHWLWPGRFARGKLNLLIGDPGLGKSWMLLDMVARVTNGRSWPDGGQAPRGEVIVLTAEDGLADTVRPRIDTQWGDAQRVYVLRAVKQNGAERLFSLSSDLVHLETALTQTGAPVAIIDPLSAYLSNTNTWKDAEVRGLLAPLAALAERLNVAVIGVMHLSKDAQRRALYRVQGSIAFTAAARSVFAVTKDPDAEARRFLVPVKLNIAPLPPTLAFILKDGLLRWEQAPVEALDAETALAGPLGAEEKAERVTAVEFLQAILADGPVPALDIFRSAKANGISDRTLNRAKRQLGVRPERIGGIGSSGAWIWLSPKVANSTDVASLVEHSQEKAETTLQLPKIATPKILATLGSADGTLSPRNGPCYACGGTRFWRSVAGRFICDVCHPPATPDLVAGKAP